MMIKKMLCKCQNLKGPLCGILLMILCQISFAIAWTSIKFLEDIPTFEIVFFRSIISLAIILPLTYKTMGTLKGVNYKLLIIRGILGFFGMGASFYAFIRLNLGDAALLLNTAPLFVAILAPFFLKEKFSKIILIWIAIAFVGLALILKPSAGLLRPAALLAIGCGLAIAISSMVIRKLHQTDSSTIIIFYFTLIITIMSFPLMIMNYVHPTLNTWILLLIIGVAVTFGQLFLTKAFKHAPTNVISPFGYLAVLIAYGIDAIVWRDIPDMASVIGAALVIIGGIAITREASKKDNIKIRPDAVPMPPAPISNIFPSQKSIGYK